MQSIPGTTPGFYYWKNNAKKLGRPAVLYGD